MNQQPNYLVMQCYGNEGIFMECAFALLSLWRLYPDGQLPVVEIWLYTDKPEWFSRFKDCPLPLHFRTLDQATIQQWRGSIDFVHRIKIEVLLDFVGSRSGNVLYTDTDVIFTHPFDLVYKDLAQGKLYMHMQEGRVSDGENPLFRKLNKFLLQADGPRKKGKSVNELMMWNAGVLGFNTANNALLKEVLEFTDTNYPKFHKHIIEQFAFSVTFQTSGGLKSALPYILHYWNIKEARVVFTSFFNHFKDCTWDELVRYSGLIQIYDLVLQKIRFGHNRTFIEKITDKKWVPPVYDWKTLSQQV